MRISPPTLLLLVAISASPVLLLFQSQIWGSLPSTQNRNGGGIHPKESSLNQGLASVGEVLLTGGGGGGGGHSCDAAVAAALASAAGRRDGVGSMGGQDHTAQVARRDRILAGMGSKNTTLRWLSFWDEEDYHPEDFVGWANFGFTRNVSQIRKGAAMGMHHLLKIQEHLWVSHGKHMPLVLRDDWQRSWANFRDAVAVPLWEEGAIFGFDMGDELLWQGLNPISLEIAAARVRDDFPRAIIWSNEAKGPVKNGQAARTRLPFDRVAPALSWFSVDIYHKDPRENFTQGVREFYNNHVYPKMMPNQTALLVPPAFSSHMNKHCDNACYEKFCVEDAWEFYKWAVEDPRIVGIMPYHWNPCKWCRNTRNEIGVKDMVETKAAWRQIGEQIIAAGEEGL